MERTAKSAAPTYSIESVDNALLLLRMICERKEVRISEVAEHLGVAQSTAHRLLSMLLHHGFARQDEKRGGYRTGPQILEMGFAAIREMDVRQYARPILEEVSAKVHETVHLALAYGQDVFYVEGIESRHQLRVGLRVGNFVPANCIGLGKAILAGLPNEQFHRLFPSQELRTLTENSVASRDELERQLEKIRKLGYASSRGESDEGVGSVAVAVLGQDGTARAAISVSAPLVRIKADTEALWIEALQSAAEKLSARLWGDFSVVSPDGTETNERPFQ
jgi:IclR family transcriptional regulator, acetate operon repressor